MTILENIKKLAKERGLTIRDVERAAGLGNATIAGWAKSDPGAFKLWKVANVLGVTMYDLIDDYDEDAEAERATDEYEAEHGADGRLAQQHGCGAW